MLRCCGSLCRVSLTSLWTICMQSQLFFGGSRTISQTGATAALSPLMLVAQNGTGIWMPSPPWRLCQGEQVTMWKSSCKHLIHSVKVGGCLSAMTVTHKRKPRGQRLWWTQNFHQHIHCHIPNVTWTMWTKILMKKIFSRKQRNTCNQLPARHSDNACNAQLLCLGSLMAVGDWLQFSPVKACILS